MGKDNVLIVGSGGREHALGWKLKQSEDVGKIYFAPGNAGTWEDGENIGDGTKKDNFPALFNFVDDKKIRMVVVGPENPLNDGIVDYAHSLGYDRVFGPSKKATGLESDKFLSHRIMKSASVPRARSALCLSTETARGMIPEIANENGVVIKARGLTGGKGVFVADSREQALLELDNHAKEYGGHVLIAERLMGEEFSVFGISDGNRVYPFEMSFQDHKRLLDGDRGPNTGGMGAYGPAPIASAEIVRHVADEMMTPVVQKMKDLEMEYQGFLYAGMIMTREGPKVIEFNARFGDPECQPAMMMLKSDLYQVLSNSLDGNLDGTKMEFNPGAALCVVQAMPGYPKKYEKDAPISGLENVKGMDGVKVFHAGTALKDGKIVTSGGRVLGVTAYSPRGFTLAQPLAYAAAIKINIPGGFHQRSDIGYKALRRINM